MKGKLIVIEGSDGSGKTTQLELLKQYVQEQKVPFKTLKFPQYKGNFFGKTIAQFLRGELGDLKRINPYLISMIYAMDRAEARDQMYQWLNSGKVILLDRYVSSNMAHQCGRLPKSQRARFLRWIDELEYRVNNVPREDIVLYLHVPYQLSLQLMQNTDRNNRNYMQGGKQDLVERNNEYLKKSEEVYITLARKFPHWMMIECMDENGILRSRKSIHEEIVSVLHQKHLLSSSYKNANN